MDWVPGLYDDLRHELGGIVDDHPPVRRSPHLRPVPARVLLAEVKALPEETESVESLFKAGTVSVNGRCDIITQDADEFPEMNLPAFEGRPTKEIDPQAGAQGCPVRP